MQHLVTPCSEMLMLLDLVVVHCLFFGLSFSSFFNLILLCGNEQGFVCCHLFVFSGITSNNHPIF